MATPSPRKRKKPLKRRMAKRSARGNEIQNLGEMHGMKVRKKGPTGNRLRDTLMISDPSDTQPYGARLASSLRYLRRAASGALRPDQALFQGGRFAELRPYAKKIKTLTHAALGGDMTAVQALADFMDENSLYRHFEKSPVPHTAMDWAKLADDTQTHSRIHGVDSTRSGPHGGFWSTVADESSLPTYRQEGNGGQRNPTPATPAKQRRPLIADPPSPPNPHNIPFSKKGRKRRYAQEPEKNRIFGPPQEIDLGPPQKVYADDVQDNLWNQYPQAYRIIRMAAKIPGLKPLVLKVVNRPTPKALNYLFGKLSAQGGVYGRVDWDELHKQLMDYQRIKHYRDSETLDPPIEGRDGAPNTTRTDQLYDVAHEVPMRFGPPLDHDPDLTELRHQLAKHGIRRRYGRPAVVASVKGLDKLLHSLSISPHVPHPTRLLANSAFQGDTNALQRLGRDMQDIDLEEYRSIDWDRITAAANQAVAKRGGQFDDTSALGVDMPLRQAKRGRPVKYGQKKAYGNELHPGSMSNRRGSMGPNDNPPARQLGKIIRRIRRLAAGPELSASGRRSNSPFGQHGEAIKKIAHDALRGDATAVGVLNDYLDDIGMHEQAGVQPGQLNQLAKHAMAVEKRNQRYAAPSHGLGRMEAISQELQNNAEEGYVGLNQVAGLGDRRRSSQFDLEQPRSFPSNSSAGMSLEDRREGKRLEATAKRNKIKQPAQLAKKGKKVRKGRRGINAPAGGVVVRGNFYQGGKYIPEKEVEKATYAQYLAVQKRRYQRDDGSYDVDAALAANKKAGV